MGVYFLWRVYWALAARSAIQAWETRYCPWAKTLRSLVIGMQLCGERLLSATKLFLALTAITILTLLPINYFWWKALGWI